MNNIYVNKEGFTLEKFETPISTGWIKTEKRCVESQETIIPKVKKISQDQWKTIISFLQWVWDEHKSEGLLYGLYHTEKKEWLFVVPNQEVSSSAVETDELNFSQLNEGYQLIFSIHTHGSMSAFQSGQDQRDEIDGYGAGFHITLGNMDKPEMSIHCRAKFVLTQTDEDGFVIPNTKAIVSMAMFQPWNLIDSLVEPSMSVTLRDQLFKWENLTSRDGEFPNEWMGSVKKKEFKPFRSMDNPYCSPMTAMHYNQGKVNDGFIVDISRIWFAYLESEPKEEFDYSHEKDKKGAMEFILSSCKKPSKELILALAMSGAKSVMFFYDLICETLTYNDMPNDETMTAIIENSPEDFINQLKKSKCRYVDFKLEEKKLSNKGSEDDLKFESL